MIKNKFNKRAFEKLKENAKQYGREQARKEIVSILQYVGLEAVKEARLNGNYTDRTGNLRSSIGFIIVDNGKVIFENFGAIPSKEKVKGSDGGTTGKKKARSFALELTKKYNQGICLIIVAGMNYASYVENGHYIKSGNSIKRVKPYNVLASAELLASNLVKEFTESLIKQLK